MAHPLRLRMLSLLTGAEMSAAEVARELGISQANASYHLRKLADAGHLVEAGEERIRGGIAKRYRYEIGPDSEPRVSRGSGDDLLLAEAIGQELTRRTAQRAEGRSYLSDAEVWIAPETWERAAALVQEASTLVHREAQPPRTPGTTHVNFTAVLFAMADRTEDSDPGTGSDRGGRR